MEDGAGSSLRPRLRPMVWGVSLLGWSVLNMSKDFAIQIWMEAAGVFDVEVYGGHGAIEGWVKFGTNEIVLKKLWL